MALVWDTGTLGRGSIESPTGILTEDMAMVILGELCLGKKRWPCLKSRKDG